MQTSAHKLPVACLLNGVPPVNRMENDLILLFDKPDTVRFRFALVAYILGLFHSRVHGASLWVGFAKPWRSLDPSREFIVLAPQQRLSQRKLFANMTVVVMIGSVRTTRQVNPNVLQVKGSAAVTGPFGRIFRLALGTLHERGLGIQVLQPADVPRSECFNPLECERPQDLHLTRGGRTIGGQSPPFGH